MRFLVAGTVGLLTCLCASATWADYTEAGDNDTFATRETVTAGERVVLGTIALTYDAFVSDQLLAGSVNLHEFTTATGGQWYAAWIDNHDGASPWVLNPKMGSFTESNLLQREDSYGSPVGFLAPALTGTSDGSGNINLKVTGDDDDFYNGNHNESGDYELYLNMSGMDVDFFMFTGLSAGTSFSAEITAGDFDTVLGMFDEDGNVFMFDDDGGAGQLSRIANGIVPDSGNLVLAVSGVGDDRFFGHHVTGGSYTLTLTAVPEPATLAMWLVGGLIGLCWWSRRRRAAA